MQQERRLAGPAAPQGERGDRGDGGAAGQVARIADQLAQRQAAGRCHGRVGEPCLGEFVGDCLADADAVEVPGASQAHAAVAVGQVGGQEPVAGAVLEEGRCGDGAERVGVGRVAFPGCADRPDVGRFRLGSVNGGRRGVAGPVELDFVEVEGPVRDPFLAAEQRGAGYPRGCRVAAAGQAGEFVAVRVEGAADGLPVRGSVVVRAGSARRGQAPLPDGQTAARVRVTLSG